MALRLIEARLPEVGGDEAEALLDELPVVDHWCTGSEDGVRALRILVDVVDTETVADRLRDLCEDRDGFRLVLVSVEATIPAVEDDADMENPGEGDSNSDPGNGPARISREELYEDVKHASELTTVYVVMVALSTIVGAVGLIRGDTAIVVGAMVIAPLLGPNIALSLAATLGDLELAVRSLKAIAVGVGTAAIASVLMGMFLPVDPSVEAIASRTQAGYGDIALALSAGAAGSLAFTGGASAVVVGVMVAVALLPPLVVAGLLAGAGYMQGAIGAVVLVGINVACINLAAVGTFLIQKVRPRNFWEEDRAKKAVKIAVASWLILLVLLVAMLVLADLGITQIGLPLV